MSSSSSTAPSTALDTSSFRLAAAIYANKCEGEVCDFCTNYKHHIEKLTEKVAAGLTSSVVLQSIVTLYEEHRKCGDNVRIYICACVCVRACVCNTDYIFSLG